MYHNPLRWDGCGQGNKKYLDRLLKRAAGIIAGRKATDTDIQQTLKWPSLYNAAENIRSAYRSISVSMAWLLFIY